MRLNLAFIALLVPVALHADNDTPIGGGFFIRAVPADAKIHRDARTDLVREANGVRYEVERHVGQYRFYTPDCVAYEYGQIEDFHYIHFVCGAHRPVRVAYLNKRGILFDDDGIRPGLGVEMRPNPGHTSNDTDFEPRAFIELEALRAATLSQPEIPPPRDLQVKQATHTLLWAVAFIIAMAVGAIYALRRLRE